MVVGLFSFPPAPPAPSVASLDNGTGDVGASRPRGADMTEVTDQVTDATTNPIVGIVRDQRPWGRFDQFVANERVTVKTLVVEPGQRLSLQSHRMRGEMWHVLDGPMEVTVGEQTWSAEEGETIWVPAGTVHRMGNRGTGRARILEVAFGYFDEDDITRLQDDYRR